MRQRAEYCSPPSCYHVERVDDARSFAAEVYNVDRVKSARVDDRKIVNAIFYLLRAGMPWRDLPARYGPYTIGSSGSWALNSASERAANAARICQVT